jgi:hypothetical protein
LFEGYFGVLVFFAFMPVGALMNGCLGTAGLVHMVLRVDAVAG